MKRIIGAIDGTGNGVCIEMDAPDLQAGEVEIDVAASLISPGSELGQCVKLRKHPNLDALPRPFGYANSGTVLNVGEGVSQFSIGERVACMGAGYALHSDRAFVPQNLCVSVPEGVSFKEAASAHLAATALHAIRRTVPLFGENGMVMGLGLVGQLCVQFGRLSGCHILAVDKNKMRLGKAKKSGAEDVVDCSIHDPVDISKSFTKGYGLDFGILAFGGDGSEAFSQIYRSLKKTPDQHHMGRITIVGGANVSHGYAAGLGNVDVRSAARTGPGYHDEEYEYEKDYPSVFVEWPTQRNLEECLRAIDSGSLKVKHLYTHEFRLRDINEAVDALVERPNEALGVILTP